MSRVQIILTPAGERLAIMPAEDYEALISQSANADEDKADLARIDEVLSVIQETGSNAISLEAMKRILAGENPIRVWREERGMSRKDLAAKAGIKPNYVSMIEGGERKGSPPILKRIAKTLGVDMEELVA